MKYIIILLTIALAACGVNRRAVTDVNDISFRTATKEEALLGNLRMLTEFYTRTYNTPPKVPEDLMIYIERMDEDSQLVYSNVYKYLKKNRKKLIIGSDSLISIYYKKIKVENLVMRVAPQNPCSHKSRELVDFFDSSGYLLRIDSLADVVTKRIAAEFKASLLRRKEIGDINFTRERRILEYTTNGLKDFCTGDTLDINKSTLLKNSYDFLDSIAHANRLSRITIPCFIDRSNP